MDVNFLSSNFPANNEQDPTHLYRSLGSFWVQIFQDRNVLQGYTTGLAEEAIQVYYNLAENLRQFSVKDVDLHHMVKWKPVVITKSRFNKSPFVFESNGAVFGQQPESDPFYGGQLFRFGLPKTTEGNVFSFSPDFDLADFSLIANRVIAPSVLFIPGVDVVIQNNTLFFNSDVFNSSYIQKSKVVNSFGVPETYVDSDGNVQEDEFVILWVYRAKIDTNNLYNSYGAIFDIVLPTSDSYKELLKSLMNLYVEGPTIKALNIIFAALTNSPIVVEETETVEDLYTEEGYNFAVTDKNVYRLPAEYSFRQDIKIGDTLTSGEILSEGVKLVDTIIDPYWLNREITSDKLGFASHVFASNPKNQLFFENNISLATYYNDRVNFPVIGRTDDVNKFQEHLNAPENKASVLKALGLSSTNSTAPINPVEFLFKNFFKNNTLLLKLSFYTEAQLSTFFKLYPTLQSYLPPHVYVLVYLNLRFSEDSLEHLNTALTIPGFGTARFSMDGSASLTGARPQLTPSDSLYYKDYTNRLFSVSLGPYRNSEPLHSDDNLDVLPVNNNTSKDTNPGIKCGLLRTEIPESVVPPGESEENQRLPSTREIQSILLIDF